MRAAWPAAPMRGVVVPRGAGAAGLLWLCASLLVCRGCVESGSCADRVEPARWPSCASRAALRPSQPGSPRRARGRSVGPLPERPRPGGACGRSARGASRANRRLDEVALAVQPRRRARCAGTSGSADRPADAAWYHRAISATSAENRSWRRPRRSRPGRRRRASRPSRRTARPSSSAPSTSTRVVEAFDAALPHQLRDRVAVDARLARDLAAAAQGLEPRGVHVVREAREAALLREDEAPRAGARRDRAVVVPAPGSVPHESVELVRRLDAEPRPPRCSNA